MILGIDASNIRAGGGVTHLVELLGAASPEAHGFRKVIVWATSNTLKKIAERPWLQKVKEPLLEGSAVHRIFWQCFRLRDLARLAQCNILFVPGGSDASGFKPMVTMNQNLLPFEWKEFKRYGWIKECLETDIYFCEAGSPYQKGSVENGNGLIRIELPRTYPVEGLKQRHITTLIKNINNRPLKCLNYKC